MGKKSKKPFKKQEKKISAVEDDLAEFTGSKEWLDDQDMEDMREDDELASALRRKKKSPKSDPRTALEIDADDSSSDDEDDDDDDDMAVGGEAWGAKKKYFYGGNPNEEKRLRKGQKEPQPLDDDELSEGEMEAIESKKLQKKQLAEMDEADFFDSFAPQPSTSKEKKKKNEAKKSKGDGDEEEKIQLDFSKLSKKQKSELIARESPEFAGIVKDFEIKMKECGNILAPIHEATLNGKIPQSSISDFVSQRFQLSLNYCANISCYLMFKMKRKDVSGHPLTSRLVQYKKILDQTEENFVQMKSELKDIAERLKSGENLALAYKKLKKSQMAKLKKKKKASKKLRIVSEKKDEMANGNEPEEMRNDTEMTYDERKALEMYDVIKAKKTKNLAEDSEDEEESEKDFPMGGEDNQDLNEEEAEDEEARRSITYEMAKNKGLTPKRSKLQRNPRVKHRVKYEKAKVRRRGQVRDVRKETKKYSGEASGINIRVKKGIKITN